MLYIHEEGDIGGTQYRNTVRKNIYTAFMIGHAYLKVYPSCLFAYPKRVCISN